MFLFLLVCIGCQSASAYVLSGKSWETGSATIRVDLAASNPPGPNQPNVYPNGPTTQELQSAYIGAMNVWNDTALFSFIADENSGTADICASPGVDPSNGVIFADNNCGAGFADSTLAIQQSWSSGDRTTKTGTIFNNNLQWDLYSGEARFDFNGNVGTFRAEFGRVAAHELGHAIGLNHSADNSALLAPAAGDVEIPQADDIAGISDIYDDDNDGFGIALDNCPDNPNANQADLDNDGQGDVCDADIDGDGIYNGVTVDQTVGRGALLNSFNLAGELENDIRLAQTFTVGVTGTLDRVSLPVFCGSGNLQISIQALNGGNANTAVPNGTILDQTIIASPTTSSIGFVDYSLNGVGITAGQALAVVIYSNGSCGWSNTDAANYTGGTGRFSSSGVNWFNLGEDLPFETFVLPDQLDNCPEIANPSQADTDNDGLGDACDQPTGDGDGDGIDDSIDNCPAIANPGQENADGDALGDACDPDDDNDNVDDGADNCPFTANPGQENLDGDALGNACDPDDDNDNVNDDVDNCPAVSNALQENTDNDSLGNLCDPDDDNDNINDGPDNCQFDANPDQRNNDGDALGDVCDPDDDNDGVDDLVPDNCPFTANPNQEDSNNDGVGDACTVDDPDAFCIPIFDSSGKVVLICL